MSGLRLEVFEVAESGATAPESAAAATAAEEARHQGYEQGYAAGWEDATAAQSTEDARLRSELARNLQSLSFTFEEARVHVIAALGPFLQQLVTRLLPEIAREALGPVVRDTLLPLAEQVAESPVILRVNPAARRKVEDLLAAGTAPPLRIEEEPTLGEGQASLRLGDSETLVDLDRATATLAAAVRDFFSLTAQERP